MVLYGGLVESGSQLCPRVVSRSSLVTSSRSYRWEHSGMSTTESYVGKLVRMRWQQRLTLKLSVGYRVRASIQLGARIGDAQLWGRRIAAARDSKFNPSCNARICGCFTPIESCFSLSSAGFNMQHIRREALRHQGLIMTTFRPSTSRPKLALPATATSVGALSSPLWGPSGGFS